MGEAGEGGLVWKKKGGAEKGDSREKEGRRRDGRGEEQGAVAIRKCLQENLALSNHGAAIYNAYQVT